jgi:small subunit ribosomal protein S20
MPQLKSGYKRVKKDKIRRLRNQDKASMLKTLIKKVRALIDEKKAEEAEKALRELESKLKKMAKTNTIKKEKASRLVGRTRKAILKIGKK